MIKKEWTADKLRAFEEWCIGSFYQGKIMSPLHLSGGNEKQLIEIFKDIKNDDWVFTTYRSHYHALLKGVDEEWLKKWILENKSIHVMNKENKIISSAIVGGTLSTAVGVAMGLKLSGKQNMEHVWVFVGDMTASSGLFHDAWQYSFNNNLPITFVIEDNGLSTDTPTKTAWGNEGYRHWWEDKERPKIITYKYERTHPHYGLYNRVDFNELKSVDSSRT